MGRYASRGEDIDRLLRDKVFVDLYGVVRNALRACVESYSIKRLEQFYGYQRTIALRDANIALAAFQAGLELDDASSITEGEMGLVIGYNKDDCVSTLELGEWLEANRSALIDSGTDVPRREAQNAPPSEELSAQQQRVAELAEPLLAEIPVDPLERIAAQQGQWILANILDWHRREERLAGGNISGWPI